MMPGRQKGGAPGSQVREAVMLQLGWSLALLVVGFTTRGDEEHLLCWPGLCDTKWGDVLGLLSLVLRHHEQVGRAKIWKSDNPVGRPDLLLDRASQVVQR